MTIGQSNPEPRETFDTDMEHEPEREEGEKLLRQVGTVLSKDSGGE